MIINNFKIKYVLILFLIGIISLWFLLDFLGQLNTVYIPSPSSMYNSFLELSQNKLWFHVSVTTLRVFIAVLLSFLFAIPIAIIMHWHSSVKALLSPLFDFIRYLPVPALIPLLILFLGIGESVKISVLFIGTFFQIIILIQDFLKNIPKEYYVLSYVSNFSRIKIYQMQLKAILPELWDTLRISIGWCWSYIIIAELVATDIGIGRVIKEAQRFSDSSKLYVSIIIIGFLGLFIDQFMKKMSPKLFRYRIL